MSGDGSRWIALIRSNSAIVVGETLLMGLIVFTSFSLLVRLTDAETLGLWFLLNAIIAYSRVVDFWSNGLTSFVAEALGRDERAKALEFVGTAVLTGVLGYSAIAGVSFAALYACAGWIAGPQHAETIRAILPFMAIAFWLNAIAGTYQLGFLGFSRPIFKACQTVGGALVFLGAAPLLAPTHGLSGIVLAQMAQGAFMLLFGAAAFRLAITRGAPVLRWRAAEFRKLVVFGSKAIVLGSVQLAIEPIIRILANHFGGLIAVTTVELASRLVALVRGVIVSLGQILVPTFARAAVAGLKETTRLYGDALTLFALLTLPAFSVMLSTAPLFEVALLGKSGSGFIFYLIVFSLAWIPNILSAPAYFLLFAQRKVRPLLWSHIIMSAGALLLGWVAGTLGGIHFAMTGVLVAFVVSALYLVWSLPNDYPRMIDVLSRAMEEPSLVLAASLAGIIAIAGLLGIIKPFHSPIDTAATALAIAAVVLLSARPGKVRQIIELATKAG